MGKIRLLVLEHSYNLLFSLRRLLTVTTGRPLAPLTFPPLPHDQQMYLVRLLEQDFTMPEIARRLNVNVHALIYHIDTHILPGRNLAAYAWHHDLSIHDAEWRVYRANLCGLAKGEY